MGKQHSLTRLLPKEFHPPQGRKEVWLPSFTITLLRTTYLPANMACFQVPLNMNKLDMKDYLWNAYEIPVLSVRSYIQQQKVRAEHETMIVELGEGEHGGPFVWPEPYDDLSEFEKKSWDQLRQRQENLQDQSQHSYSRGEKKDASALAEQAKALLSGAQKWKPSKPIYVNNNA